MPQERIDAIERWLVRIERGNPSKAGVTKHGIRHVAFRHIRELLEEVRRLQDELVESHIDDLED